MAIAFDNGTVGLYVVKTGEMIQSLKNQYGPVRKLRISLDNRYLAAQLRGDGKVALLVWDLLFGSVIGMVHTEDLGSGLEITEFAPDSGSLLLISEKGTLQVHRLPEFTNTYRYELGDGYQSTGSFSRDGEFLIAASDKMVLVRTTDWQEIPIDTVATSVVDRGGAFFTPNSQAALIGFDCEGSIRLINCNNGKTLRTFPPTLYGMSNPFVDLSDDVVITRSFDGSAQFWDIATGKLLASLTQLRKEGAWVVTTPEGFFDSFREGAEAVSFRVGKNLNVFPVDRYFKDLWYPGLLAAILRGERPLPTVDISDELPPKVSILSPETESELDNARVTLEALIEDLGGGYQQPWVTVNDVRVEVETEHARSQAGEWAQEESARGLKRESPRQLRWKFKVELEEGPNIIRVHSAAEEKEGIATIESDPAEIVIHSTKPKLPTELYLLAVGVSQYKDNVFFPNLPSATNDAQAIADLFRSRGEDSYGEGHVHIRTLLNDQATKANIEKALGEISEQAGPQDVLVLALAGHGKQNGQRYYFIPHEFSGSYATDLSIALQDHDHGGLPIDVIGGWVRNIPARKRVMILDACESGGALGSLYAVLSRGSYEFQRAFGTLQRNTGLRLIAASSPTQQAYERDDLRHGYLTYALLAGLDAVDHGPLDGKRAPVQEGFVNVDDWLSFAKEHVPELSKEKQLAGVLGAGKDFPILSIRSR